MNKIKKNIIGLSFVLIGLFGLILSMNENANHINFIGVIIFGVSCFFGALHAKDSFHPVQWIKDKWWYYIIKF